MVPNTLHPNMIIIVVQTERLPIMAIISILFKFIIVVCCIYNVFMCVKYLYIIYIFSDRQRTILPILLYYNVCTHVASIVIYTPHIICCPNKH